ncbi:MAG: hypothetical protein AB7N65_29770, partial [Vicinamibacterales bacterium]
VELSGIDRYFERYYRNGPRRRPVRDEFCDTDVRDVFDEWRRAFGVASRVARESGPSGSEATPSDSAAPAADPPRGPPLPAHLERVLLRLSSARATGTLGAEMDAVIDRVAVELDDARAHARGVRGEARRAMLERLSAIDQELLDTATAALPLAERSAVWAEAAEELATYRERLTPAAFEAAVSRSAHRLLRERLGLPVVSIT